MQPNNPNPFDPTPPAFQDEPQASPQPIIVPGGAQQVPAERAVANFGQPVVPTSIQQPQPTAPAGPGVPGTVPAVVVPKNHTPWWVWLIVGVLSLLVIGAAGFAFWAFGERQDYKNNTDQKIAVAEEATRQKTTEENNKQFAEEAKNPLRPYTGPAEFGSISLQYPKTWSGYVDTASSGSAAFTALFHPGVVPAQTGKSGSRAAVALKVEVLNREYSTIVKQRESLVRNGELSASAYAFPKQENQIGTKFVGKLSSDLNGTELIVPLRDKTLIVTTETDQYLNDFTTYILPNFNFEP